MNKTIELELDGREYIDSSKLQLSEQRKISNGELVDSARMIRAAFQTGSVDELISRMPAHEIISISDDLTNGDSRLNDYLQKFAYKSYKTARKVAVGADEYLPDNMILEPRKSSKGWKLELVSLAQGEAGLPLNASEYAAVSSYARELRLTPEEIVFAAVNHMMLSGQDDSDLNASYTAAALDRYKFEKIPEWAEASGSSI